MKLVTKGVARPPDSLAQRITALDHEFVNHAVEDHAVIVGLRNFLIGAWVRPLLRTLGQPHEVLNRLWGFLVEEAGGEVSFARDELRVDSGQRRLPLC